MNIVSLAFSYCLIIPVMHECGTKCTYQIFIGKTAKDLHWPQSPLLAS